MLRMSYTEAIRAATLEAMAADDSVHMIGLGVTYPNGADGTTGGLLERFPGRVHDMPCSEAGMTGMCVGAAAAGLRPVIHHGRIEFAMFAADALITQAAKWNYMFGGGYPCPLTVRVAIGRQWGNGPQHTQVSRALFAVPGLKVVVASHPDAAAGLLLAAIEDDNPVIVFEQRWLYKTVGPVTLKPNQLDKAVVMKRGTDVTIVAAGDMVLEALKAARLLRDVARIDAEVIDIVSLNPVDYDTIYASVSQTNRLVVADTTTGPFDLVSEVAFGWNGRKVGVRCPSTPCPTAPGMSWHYYPDAEGIALQAAELCGDRQVRFSERRTFEDIHLPPKDDFGLLAELSR